MISTVEHTSKSSPSEFSLKMTTPEIWHRQFTRVSGWDNDTLLTVEQQQKLQDKFGQFLQGDSHWTLNTLDGMLSYYYSKLYSDAQDDVTY
jgi:hypothetical protein